MTDRRAKTENKRSVAVRSHRKCRSMFRDVVSLKEAGFQGFWTVAQLRAMGLISVPNEGGIYLALWTDEYVEFLDESTGTSLNGRDPTVPTSILYDRWNYDSVVVYIGKAGGPSQKATLRTRLNQFLQFGKGVYAPHWGGRYVWQIADSDSIRICWHTGFNLEPRWTENLLILRFKSEFGGRYPFANLRC